MVDIAALIKTVPQLYNDTVAIKLVEVAKKYNTPEGEAITRVPEYTTPGGPNSYHCSKAATAWTQGFFPGLLWLLVERNRLSPGSIESLYSEEEIIKHARKYQDSFKFLARPSVNHDQGFRFQLSYGKDYELTGSEEGKEVLIEASDSLEDRYDPNVGAIRSWDIMVKVDDPIGYTRENMHEHYLTIIDNMMNLDMLYEATKITGNPKYAEIANAQAEASSTTHVRPDDTTYHVINFDQKTRGATLERRTHQGYADESCWSRGQAWGIYGYAQCALRSGRKDFLDISRRLADKFLSLLGPTGVPEWDFDAPKPCPYDASAATITARGLQMLYQLLLPTDPKAAEEYLRRGFKLVEDTLRECWASDASLKDGQVDFGKDGWETILSHSTINGNLKATRRLMDHGLVYADYYLVEFGNEALKLNAAQQANPSVNGHANGHSNGHANGHANGVTNGHANGH